MPVARVLSSRSIPATWEQMGWKNQQYQCGSDCACETGLQKELKKTSNQVSISSELLHTNHNLIPKLRTGLYQIILNPYVAMYNPNGHFGIAVLDEAAQKILGKIDEKRTIQEIACILNWSLEDISLSIDLLEKAELIYTCEVEPPIEFRSSQNVAVWMHITNQCNLRCSYCYLNKTSEKMSRQIGEQALEEIFASAKKNQRNSIWLKYAGGEALSVFTLIEQLTNYARQLESQNGISVLPIILTNGTLITPQLAKKIKAGNYVIALSLDGLAEYNDVTRPFRGGKGSFEKIENSINLLLEHEINFNVSIVITKYNLKHLPVLTEYLLAHKLSFTYNFFRENEWADNSLSIENSELTHYLEMAYALILENLPSFSLLNAILDRVQFNQPHQFACGVGSNYVVVKHTGEIVGCQMHLQKPAIGALHQGIDLLQLIREKNFVLPSARVVNNKEGCRNCQWQYVCAGGCPIITLSSKGVYDTRSPFCESYKALIPKVLEIEAQRILKYSV